MKNALLLHSTNGTPSENWLPWLTTKLEERGYAVWVPQLPLSDTPSIGRYTEFLLGKNAPQQDGSLGQWDFNSESLIIGHSSGAVAALGLLQALPKDIQIDTTIMVGAFKDTLGWDALKEMFEPPLEYPLIRKKARRKVFLHSTDDPYCPMEHAGYLAVQTEAELVLTHKDKHFSIEAGGERFRELPLLLEILNI